MENDKDPDATEIAPILEWYSRLHSRRVDIIGDYAGNELFLIHGESLLLHCFADEGIDFENLELLHAVYAVERFLHGLVSRRCNFHVAFFDEHSELCIPLSASAEDRNKYLFTRTAIIRHLRANLHFAHPEIEVNLFPSLASAECTSYLNATDLYFVLAHDGATAESLRTRSILSKHLDALKDEEHKEPEESRHVKLAYRNILHWFMQRGFSAALVNGFEFRDTKAVTSVLENTRRFVDTDSLTLSELKSQTATSSSTNPSSRDALGKIESTIKDGLTERECLAVLVASKLGSQNKAYASLSLALLQHIVMLSQLSLSHRLLEEMDVPDVFNSFLLSFCSEARDLLESESWADDVAQLKMSCDIGDCIDGRLLAVCRQNQSIGNGTRLNALLQAVESINGLKLPNVAGSGEVPQINEEDLTSDQASYAVLPFANSVFDAHLSPVHLAVDRVGGIADATSATIFREVSHWHNYKRPIDPKIREDQIAKNEKQMWRARRRNQWFMAEMTTYAASLTNAVGKSLDPEIVTSGKSKPTAAAADTSQDNAKAKQTPKGGKKGTMTKKQAMMAEIAASKSKKEEANTDNVLQGWRLTSKTLNDEPTTFSRYQKAKQYISTLNTDLKRKALEAEVRLYMLNVLLELWVSKRRKQTEKEDFQLAALIFDSVKSFAKLPYPVTKTIASCLKNTIDRLGLPPLGLPSVEGDRPLAFNCVMQDQPSNNLAVSLSPKQFQLLHCGPYFERSIDSTPDSRVPFEPDAWQRKVLDEIDARRSLLVIAPTSAGKTFISFYAMKQVLESNDDDILVYVAPTKALVNQIAAEVQARFSKTYKYGGNSVWGIHTRDYRINNPTGCQVLVTVPHILQIMLLAPSHANSWSKRVKWIIFDEVHCIGQADDGLVWEQLLLLAPCPIIALSATIGNAEEFNAWLRSTQNAVGNELVMVQHPHRYSDLRKFVYTPPKSTKDQLPLTPPRPFSGLGLDDYENFTFLHPVSSLANRARDMPHDLSLEARDCLTLWETMSKHQTVSYPVAKELDPKSALPAVVGKVDIIKWELSLKAALREWMTDNDSPFEAVLKDLSPEISQQKNKDQEEEEEEDTTDGKADIETMLPLLSQLHEQDALPGIVFNYDRGRCEKICQTLLSQLSAAEAAWKESSPKWEAMLQKWEDWKKMMAKASKRGPPKVSKKKGGEEGLTKEDLMKDAANTDTSPWASFDPNKPIDGFHFADNKKASLDELTKYEKELIRREVPQWTLDILRRGIGVHHAGMNRKYRQVVEILFRKGFLRVVVATGTLALGINMPCKTVIFSGDSVFLTALNYRQAAGRAGRRGFDMLGNVVFHGISLNKIHRLISSRLPDLNGHFPITTTLVLRLFSLLNESKNSPFAISSINALLSQPRLYLGGEESKMTVLHHLRFSIEYLRRQFLLDSTGAPLNFAGCVSHLYFTENSSFAFHALLKDGYFHKLCADIGNNQEAVLRELMLTMSHLFGRQYCRQADEEYIERVIKRSPSIVFLPEMPKDAADILRSHNESTLDIFSAYVRTFVDQHLKEPDNQTPLTNFKVGGDSKVQISKELQRPPTKVRSPFVALSGHDDEFESVHELCTTSRSGVFLEESVVPYVGLYPEESEMPLNAYLYDYFMHSDIEAIVHANRIRRGDVWFVLNDFSMVLATIVTSLSNFMNLTAASDLTDVRGEGEDEEERQEDKLLPEDKDSGYETGSSFSAASAVNTLNSKPMTLQPKKKKKVADSWDDDADEEEKEAEVLAKEQERNAQMEQMMEKPAWEANGLLNVLKAFKALKEDFDTKFRAMWA